MSPAFIEKALLMYRGYRDQLQATIQMEKRHLSELEEQLLIAERALIEAEKEETNQRIRQGLAEGYHTEIHCNRTWDPNNPRDLRQLSKEDLTRLLELRAEVGITQFTKKLLLTNFQVGGTVSISPWFKSS